MSLIVTPFMRKTLALDAIVSGAAALLMIAGSSYLSLFLNLPAALLFWAGLVLAPFVALLVALARLHAVSRLLLIDIIAVNGLWVATSFGLLASGAVIPNLWGNLFVAAQALAVAAFAILQTFALRQAPSVAV
ncbi:hypothetical protein GA830_11180 [Mesorhizobium sp. NBSH29]|uniref:hypothetical protein n=1 Tax=Mesorhizobium sp. NBSH29 TaxID=2654249 RepID=UPI0018968EB5|nr:hypothetical protein [Mesorhizobium sp. NBSH29]QPC87240.1 hypothetical protein GA830_11180 [Mesorhizobium sp. NBSH29]